MSQATLSRFLNHNRQKTVTKEEQQHNCIETIAYIWWSFFTAWTWADIRLQNLYSPATQVHPCLIF